MIFIKTWYKIYNYKLLSIIKVLKINEQYLKSNKQKMVMLTNYNNFCHFINRKNSSFK